MDKQDIPTPGFKYFISPKEKAATEPTYSGCEVVEAVFIRRDGAICFRLPDSGQEYKVFEHTFRRV